MPARFPASSKQKTRAQMIGEPPVGAGESSTWSGKAIPLVLVAAGGIFWLLLGPDRAMAPARWTIILIGAALAALPPVARWLEQIGTRVRRPSPQSAARIAVAIAIVAAIYLVLTAFSQDRDLFPKTEDENSYLLGMQMLARGRLWMRALPLPDFFDSFYILTRPVYCSIYFPGTAIMFVPTIWMHWPSWLMPAMAGGAIVGLTYRVFTELMDGVAGLLGALLIVSLTWFRTYSILLTSHLPMLLLGLLMIWAWLRWRRHQNFAWVLVIGALAGWAAITRPVDALAYAIPVGVAMALAARQRLKTAALLLLGALPFLSVQLFFDAGVTGNAFKTPYTQYLDHYQPGTSFGIHRYDPRLEPHTTLPQLRAYYDWCRTYLVRHQPNNFLEPWVRDQHITSGSTRPSYVSMIVDTTLPSRSLLLLAMAGIVGLSDARRRVLWAVLPLFVLLYVFNPFFLEHYAIAVIPAVILMVFLGLNAVADLFPRRRQQVRAGLAAFIVLVAITSFWEINRLIVPPGKAIKDEPFDSSELRALNNDYPESPEFEKPAVVLFRYHARDNFFEEPVFNSSVAWPDDAAIVRAHDLGPERDREIVAYYARQQPPRAFYLFDAKAKEPMRFLGTADQPAEILRRLNSAELPASDAAIHAVSDRR